MIIVKAPLRVSLGGGGTDLPSYYEKFGSTFISAAINKYIYISVHPIFIPEIILKYSEMERVTDIASVKHPLIRESLKLAGVDSAVEISSFADIPAGTGLGSSGAFTVALLKALYTFKHTIHDNIRLAEDACRIEIEKLGSPVGKQDQYCAAMGGLTQYQIARDGKVEVSPFIMDPSARTDLEEHLLLFFTGYSRSANLLLQEQDELTRAAMQKPASSKEPSQDMLQNLHFVQQLGHEIAASLKAGNLNEFARLMNVHWEHKQKRSKNMSSAQINHWYELGMKNGALGGKLIGAGGGGFLMFLAEDKRRLRKVLREAGMRDVPFKFDHLGAQVVLHD